MQPTRVQDAATLRSGEDSVFESDDSSVTSSLISSSSFDHTSTFAMLQPIPGATSNSIEYDPSQVHPEWGAGYEPDPNGFNDNTFAFNFTSLTFSKGSPTDMMKTIAAAAGQGWDLFANAPDPDSSRIIINDPGQGNDLLIGNGLQLVVGATLRDLLKKNGIDITNSATRKLIKGQSWGKKFLSQLDNLISAQNGPGHMIVWNKTGVMVSAGDNKATMEVGAGNKLYVGDTNSSGYDAFGTGNLQLGYNEKSVTGSAALTLDEGSYLSVNGFLGGAADKSYAGQSIGSGMEDQRTGAVSTQNHVKMDVDGNWGLVGDIRPDKPANLTRVGNNNKINVGGTLGVYMLASMTIGSGTEISVGSNGWAHTGSGVFVGSGGYMSTGLGNRFTIAGGMGAGYMDLSASGKAAQLIIGDKNVIHLTNRNAGIFAAEAGAFVSAGDHLTLTGAEISVGYGQNSMDRIIDGDSKYRTAHMSIGNDANISLGYENLYPMANAPSFAEDGVIRLDASNSLLQFGTGLALEANIISLGHYLKDTSNSNFIDSDGSALAEFRVGSNNSVVIGSGANISLGSGIVINENQGYVDLQGGVLNAGYIRMGRYYIENLEVPINGSSYIYQDNSSASIHIGDGYQVSLTQDITIDGSFDRLNIGDHVGIQGSGMYLGDFRGIGSETNHPTSGSLISAGNLTSMIIKGDINLNGVSNTVMLGSQSLLETTDGNLNIDGINQLLTIGNGGILSAAKTLLQNGSKSIISVGNEGRIVASAIQLIGNGETFTIGDNAGISADRIIIGYRGGSLTIGKNVDFDVHNFDVNVSRTVTLGDGATGYIGDTTTVDKTVFNTGNANNLEFGNISLGDNNKFNVSGSIKGAGISLGSNTSFTAATSASVNLGSGNVTLSGTGNNFTLNNNVTFTAGTVVADLNMNNFTLGLNDIYDVKKWNLSNSSSLAKTFTVGNGATGNFGNVNLLGENVTFNTGKANNLEFGNISLGDNNKFNVSGSITGTGISLGSNTSFTAVTNASVNFGSGNVMLSGTGNNFILNNNVAFTAGTVVADLNTNDFTLGSNDIYDVKGWNLSNSSSLAKTFAVADGATGNFGDVNLSGNITFNTGNMRNLTFGNVTLSGAGNNFILNNNVAFTAGTVVADLNTNDFTLGSNDIYDVKGWNLSNSSSLAKTFAVADGATGNFGDVNLSGNITFNTGNMRNLTFGNVTLSGAGNNFILNNNVAFTAGTVVADLNTNDFTLGSNDIYDVKGWNLSNSSSLAKTFAVADGATGNFGDVNLTGMVNFSTGLANNLTLDTVMLNKNASINLDGTYVTVHNLNMSNGGVANLNYNSAESNVVSLSNVTLSGNGRIKIAQNSEVDIGSLTMDGVNPGVIELDNDAVLNIRSINATNVGTDMPTIIIHNGARVIVNGQQITRSSSSNDLIADFNNEANGVYEYHGSIEDVDGHLVIKNFKLDDHLLFENDTGSSDVNTFYTCYKDGILSIIHNDGKTSKTIASFRYDAGDSNQALPNVNIVRGSDGNSYFDITKCFLLGTNILTSKGEKSVESLSVGDEVVAICNNGRINRKIVWIGKTDISVDQGKNRNDLYPVCIKAHAFGLNKPHRDLYLTPEHTVYIDGGLIPVRMLVNGRSIVIDKSRDKFQIYHVETEQHSILLSENLMTESYLNTDDKYLFDNDIVNFGLEFNEHAGHKSWENDAAAPLTVSRSKVEPIWNRLDRRATQLGYKPIIKRAITRNPDLCLITDKGKKIKPVHFKDNIYSFFIPDGTYVVAMNSKTSLPSDVIGPFIDDRRTLGVLVSKISVISNRTLIMFPTDISELSGWHSIEPDRTDRWTMGLAQLPIEITRFGTGKKLIRVELTDTASYFVEDDINEMMKLA